MSKEAHKDQMELVLTSMKDYTAKGYIWTDSLSAEEQIRLGIDPKSVTIGDQTPFEAEFQVIWDDDCPYPLVENFTLIHDQPEGENWTLEVKEEDRVDIEMLEDDIHLRADPADWLADQHRHQIDEAYDSFRDGGL